MSVRSAGTLQFEQVAREQSHVQVKMASLMDAMRSVHEWPPQATSEEVQCDELTTRNPSGTFLQVDDPMCTRNCDGWGATAPIRRSEYPGQQSTQTAPPRDA